MKARERTILSVMLVLAAGCDSLMPGSAPAPTECGFEHGTALIFAGRSTTQNLGVTEVPGDPMQNDPADIYITRDEFDQGDLRGRLVCAIYANEPGFVEITVVPEEWKPPTAEQPDVGSTAESTAPTSSQIPRSPDSPTGMSRDEAIAAARDAAPQAREWDLLSATAGPLEDVFPARSEFDWSRDLSADLWIWIVGFAEGDEGAIVVLDFADGRVYDVMNVIIN